ncbi:MAG TPA: protein kinase [Planctomycetota bacterium]|nr:protein kinase [Planctomycetota bacterium]
MAGLAGMKLGGCELIEEIGQGGMGVIYRARQVSLDRIVAVKILAEHLAHNPSFVERFQREARAIAKVNHPNILAVYDVSNQDGRHFMIMELVEGGSLAELLEKQGLLDPWDAAELIRQAARGLECAAAANIIHRDVKPDNIMLTAKRVVKVSDFGLAKELDSAMTETQAVMGTPAYMSPEQCDGRDLDSRTDIYSLGGTLYRCLTGRLPFEAETAMSMMYRHKHVPLVPPGQIVPTLPASLSDVVVRMMAKDRAERFQSMTEVALALEGLLRTPSGAPDPSRTMPVGLPEPSPAGSGFTVPGADSRIFAAPQSRQQIMDTAARCKKAARDLSTQGKYAQAARELRRLLEVSPDDAEARTALRDIEKRASDKRMAGTELRTLISSGHYEEALKRWKALEEDVRDEALIKQIEHLEKAVVPALKLAEQAEAAVSGGRIEEAGVLFQKALTLDQASERAKQGLKNVERTRQRIEFLLKEGYGHRQNRDYSQAVLVWEKVLAAEPTHAQARRLIVEARLSAATEAYADEDFDKAVNHYEALLKIEPDHEEARQALAEAVVKRDRVNELRKAAQMAKAKGDLAASARAWQELTGIIPKNRVAREGLTSARKSLSLKRARRLLLVLVGLVAGVVFFVGWRNWSALGGARAALDAGNFTEARAKANRVWLPVLKAEAADIVAKANFREHRKLAEEAFKAGLFSDAVREMGLAVDGYRQLGDSDPSMLSGLEHKLLEYRSSEGVALARIDEEKGNWFAAMGKYMAAARFSTDAGLKQEAAELDRDRQFCYWMDEADRCLKDGKADAARKAYEQAKLIRPSDPRVIKALGDR